MRAISPLNEIWKKPKLHYFVGPFKEDEEKGGEKNQENCTKRSFISQRRECHKMWIYCYVFLSGLCRVPTPLFLTT